MDGYLGQGLDVGRFQVIVGVLDDTPAQFTQRFLELPLELLGARRRNGPAAKVRDEVTQSLQNGLADIRQIGSCGTGLAVIRRCGGLGQEDRCQSEHQVHRVRHTASFRWCWVSLQLPKGETPPFSRPQGGSGQFSQKKTEKMRIQAQQRDRTPLAWALGRL